MMSTEAGSTQTSESKPNKLRHSALIVLEFLIIFAVIWIPHRRTLNRHVTADEYPWLDRSKKFYFANKRGDYEQTYQKEHPGVTVMWLGSLGIVSQFNDFRESNPDFGEQVTISYYLRRIFPESLLENLVSTRIMVSYFQTTILLIAYWLARRLMGRLSAFVSFLLIAFSPFHLSITRLLHPDSLLSNIYLLAVLAYISYIRERKFYDLILSGISAGLCWLTKSPGLFLIPTVLLFYLLDLWQTLRLSANFLVSRRLGKYALAFLLWMVIAAAVFTLLWPSMWVQPYESVRRVFYDALVHAEGGHGAAVFFNGRVIEGGDLDLQFFYFYPLTFLWRTTPVVLLGLVAAGWAFFSNRKPLSGHRARYTIACLFIAVLIFSIGMTMGGKKFDRYLLPVYAPLAIIAGTGWTAFYYWVVEKVTSRYARVLPVLMLALVVGVQAYSSLSIFPYTLAYYNPLLGGSRRAPQVMQVGWGEGLDQAALYLNQKADLQKLKILSWYSQGPFSFFFKGSQDNLEHISRADFSEENWQTFYNSDYVVIYIHQWQRDLPAQLLAHLSGKQPEHSIWINGVEYVRIYKAE